MKIFVSFILGLILLTFAGGSVFAQYRKLTVILLRHAEKDISDEDNPDPELSAAGKLRAESLIKVIDKYQPDAIFSSQYKRTRATAMPLARRRGEMIQIYEPFKLNQIRDIIMSGKFKRIVVVGHNNTTPALANLLLKEKKYQALTEPEYDKIWIIKIRRYKRKPEKVTAKVILY